MDIQKLVDLEIERKALLAAAYELCRGDGYMNTKTAVIVDMLRKRATEISKEIEEIMGR